MVDTNFPTITGEEPVKEQIGKIIDYLSVLTEQLQYQLQNLDSSNWNASALTQMENNAAIRYEQLLKDLISRVDTLSNRINSAEGLAGRMTQAEEMLDAHEQALYELIDELEQARQDIEQLQELLPLLELISAAGGVLTLGGEGKTVHLKGTVYINGVLQGESEEPAEPEAPEEEENVSEAT